MILKIKTNIEKVNQFIEKHPTLVACALTAVVTHKITYTRTLNGAIMGMTKGIYEWGTQDGVLLMQRNVLLGFINERGLDDEVRGYIATLK